MQLVYFEVAPSVDIFQDSETSKLFSVPDSLKYNRVRRVNYLQEKFDDYFCIQSGRKIL